MTVDPRIGPTLQQALDLLTTAAATAEVRTEADTRADAAASPFVDADELAPGDHLHVTIRLGVIVPLDFTTGGPQPEIDDMAQALALVKSFYDVASNVMELTHPAVHQYVDAIRAAASAS